MCRRCKGLTALFGILVICIFLFGDAAADAGAAGRNDAYVQSRYLPDRQLLSEGSAGLPSVDCSQAKKKTVFVKYRTDGYSFRKYLPLYIILIMTFYLSSWKFVKRVFFAYSETYEYLPALFMRSLAVRDKKDGKKRRYGSYRKIRILTGGR